MWIVLNYHPSAKPGDPGSYLVTREDDDVEKDGQMAILPADQLAKHRMVDFLDDGEPEFDD
jgi:hypothetical protein